MDGKTAQALLKSRGALRELAGVRRPLAEMKDYPCHSMITTPEKCGRCSRQIAAWDAIDMINAVLPKGLNENAKGGPVERMQDYLIQKYRLKRLFVIQKSSCVDIYAVLENGAERHYINSGCFTEEQIAADLLELFDNLNKTPEVKQ